LCKESKNEKKRRPARGSQGDQAQTVDTKRRYGVEQSSKEWATVKNEECRVKESEGRLEVRTTAKAREHEQETSCKQKQ
jgi:hypothetical protein